MQLKEFNLLFIFSIFWAFSLQAQDFNMQNGLTNTCTGNFYDSGGPNNTYGPDENFTFTICPTDPSLERTEVTFTEFITDNSSDVLNVYDGEDTSANLIAQLSGNVVDPANGDTPLTLTASDGNISGCLTFAFISNGTAEDVGWAADITCQEPCVVINNTFNITPSVNEEPYYRVCEGDEITFDVTSSITDGNPDDINYTWDFDDGTTATGSTVTNTFNEAGFYEVTLSNAYQDCDPVVNEIKVQVGTEPNFNLSADNDVVCLGDSVELTGDVQPVQFVEDCAIPVSDLTFLPDGNGSSYFSTITIDCFEQGQTLENASDLQEVCINIEHSWLGDLDIILIAPDGTQIFLKSVPH